MPFGVKKERDVIFSQLEHNVFSKLRELTKDDIQPLQKHSVSFVSFEDAVRELAEFHKKNQ